MASTGPGIGIDEQAGGEAQDQIAVRHPAAEDRRGLGRLVVHMGVEGVAGEMGEMLDIGERDGAARGLQRVPISSSEMRLRNGWTSPAGLSAPGSHWPMIFDSTSGEPWSAVRCM